MITHQIRYLPCANFSTCCWMPVSVSKHNRRPPLTTACAVACSNDGNVSEWNTASLPSITGGNSGILLK